MPRPQRIEFPGAWYHVMNRGAGRRTIFRTDAQRRGFLDLLGEARATYGLGVHAYCLMGNHFHLLLHTPRANLSAAMRHLSSVYTQRFNRSLGTDGALFRGRYKAVLIDADSYLAQVSRYVHLNPVAAGLVPRPERYRWSSYASYIDRRSPPAWLQVAATLALFGPRRAQARYRAFVEQGVDEEIEAFYGKKNLSSVLGGAAFLKTLRPKHKGKAPPAQLRRALRTPDIPSLKTIAVVTAAKLGVDPQTLRQPLRGRGKTNTPRLVAMALARTPGGYALSSIAEAFRAGNISSVSLSTKRLAACLEKDPALAKRVNAIRRELFGS